MVPHDDGCKDRKTGTDSTKAASPPKAYKGHAFNYQPLSKARREFRLINLLSSNNFESPLKAHLFHSNLDEYLAYETISYVWGDPSVVQLIQVKYIEYCTGSDEPDVGAVWTKLAITPNLADALRRLRYSYPPRTMWIDSICINQLDNVEKGWQIQEMANIYRQGVRSIWWFGEMTGRIRKAQDSSKVDSERSASLPRIHNVDPDLESHLVHNKFWCRIWIIQEVAFASNPILYYGNHVISAGKLCEFLNKWGKTQKMINAQLMLDEREHYLGRDVQNRDKHKRDLISLYSRFRHFESTDPRDKLYAILNLAEDTFSITPRYDLTLAEMWRMVVNQCMEKRKGLLCLYKDPFTSMARRLPLECNLPSWMTQASFANRSNFYDNAIDNSLDKLGAREEYLPATVDAVPREVGDLAHKMIHEHEYIYPKLLDDDPHSLSWSLVIGGIQIDTLFDEIPQLDFNLQTIYSKGRNSLGKLSDDQPAKLKLIEHFDGADTWQPPIYLNQRPITRSSASQALGCRVWLQNLVGVSIWDDPRWTLFSDREILRDREDDDLVSQYFPIRERRVTTEEKQALIRNYEIWGARSQKNSVSESLPDYLAPLRLVVTPKGFLALLPPLAILGDVLFMLHGCPVPMVLRPIPEQNDHFSVIGQAYVHGVMSGQTALHRQCKDPSHVYNKSDFQDTPQPNLKSQCYWYADNTEVPSLDLEPSRRIILV